MRWKRHLEVLRIAKIIFVNVRIIKIYTYLDGVGVVVG